MQSAYIQQSKLPNALRTIKEALSTYAHYFAQFKQFIHQFQRRFQEYLFTKIQNKNELTTIYAQKRKF